VTSSVLAFPTRQTRQMNRNEVLAFLFRLSFLQHGKASRLLDVSSASSRIRCV
jgi:hypothetical protein